MENLNKLNKEFKKNKKYIYICNSILILIQFVASYQCSYVDPRQLGISAIYIAIFSICLQSGHFEGNYLYLSGTIDIKQLRLNSKGTSNILIIIQLIMSIFLMIQNQYIALGFFSQFSLSGYGFWLADMKSGVERRSKTIKAENNYSKSMLKQLIVLGIIPATIKCILLMKEGGSNIIWILYSISLIVLSIYLLVKYIGIVNNREQIKEYVPKIRYLIAPTIKRTEGNLFTLILGLILGPYVLGNLQPLLKIAKSTNILTPIFLKMNYMKIDRTIKRNTLIYIILIYILTISIGYIIYFMFKRYELRIIDNISLISIISIFAYFTSQNYKSYLWTLYYKLKLSKQAIIDRIVLLLIKLIQLIIFYSLSYRNIYFPSEYIITLVVIPEIIYLIWTTKYYIIKRNTII